MENPPEITDETPQIQRVANHYDESKIIKMTALEAVRKRPGMYIGDIGVTGLHHLFKEILHNSIDEVMAGHCDQIDVALHADDSLSVTDNGRGISCEVIPELGQSAIEVVMTEIHAGRKSCRMLSGGGYKTSGGLFGVGAMCVNALSDRMETTVKRDGNIYQLRCERGKVVEPLTVIGTCDPKDTGTTQRFLPDRSVFANALSDDGRLGWSVERLVGQMRLSTFLNPGLTITFTDERLGCEPQVLHSANGIVDLVTEHAVPLGRVHERVIQARAEHSGVLVDVAFWFTEADPTWQVFANQVHMRDGGEPLIGFRQGVSRTIGKVARQTARSFQPKEAKAGVCAVIAVRLKNPQFGSPSRFRLDNPEAASAVWAIASAALEAHFAAYPDERERILSALIDGPGVSLGEAENDCL